MSDHDELRDIAAGLGAQARRERSRGKRRVRSGSTENAPKAVEATAAPVRAPVKPAAAPLPLQRPAANLFGAAAAALAPAPLLRSSASAPTEADARAAEVRAKAKACNDLESLRAAVAQCTACDLCKTRTQTVFADGSADARVMFVGEGPGEHEDRQGVPFVGRAGQLLTDIVEKGMQLARKDVYIANVVKCRPPENRDPTDAEKRVCTPWLDRQVELVDPDVLVPLGRHAANHVLGYEGPRALAMNKLRGAVHERDGRKVVPTFHPAYLLRSPGEKKECWKDIQLAMTELGLPLRRPS